MVQPAHECAVVAPPPWHSATMAPTQWQGAAVVQPTYRYAVAAQPPGQCATVARAPTALRRHGAGSVAGHHRGAALCLRGRAPSWCRPMPPWRQFSGSAPSWCRRRTHAPSWRNPQGRVPPRRCPDSLAPTWRQFSDMAPPWCSQRPHAPSWRNLQGRAPPWCCPDGLRAPAWPWCILQADTRGTMARSAPSAPPTSVTPRAEVTSHRRYSPPHVPSANIAVSLGHHRGAIFWVTCRLGARIVGLVVWARPLRPGVVGDLTAVHHRGAMAVTHVPHSQNPGVPRPPAVRVIVWRDCTRDAGGTQPAGSGHSRAGPRSI